MPNGAVHRVLGASTGALAVNHYVLPRLTDEERKEHGPTLFVGSVVAGGIGGRFPDLVEPAIHPKHRSFFHSVVVGCVAALGLGLTIKAVTELPRLQPGREASRNRKAKKATSNDGLSLKHLALATVMIAAMVGVLSHLFADSRTPDGLPLIN